MTKPIPPLAAALLALAACAAPCRAETNPSAGAPAPAEGAAGQTTGGMIMGRNLYETFQRGGPVMWPILLCSVVGLAFVFERLVALRREVVFPRRLLDEAAGLVRAGKLAEAAQVCGRDPSPFGRLLSACLGRADASGFEMEAALEEAGSRILYDLRRNGRPLAVIADIAPLLGLMGTVTGMINAFESVARSGALGRTELLAAGIAEALLTTAFGLAVAIPALVVHTHFRGKADGLVRAMEDACIGILDDIRRSRAGAPAAAGAVPAATAAPAATAPGGARP
jgi:biopolymer transport protein ExbB